MEMEAQKLIQGGGEKVVSCEVETCRQEMQMAGRSGMKGREFAHLLMVNNA